MTETATTERPLDLDYLKTLPDDRLKQLCKGEGVSIRGKWNRETKMSQLLEKANGKAFRFEGDVIVLDGEADEDMPTTTRTVKKKDIQIEAMNDDEATTFMRRVTKAIRRKDPATGESAHPHLEHAEFNFFWRHGWKAEKDTNRVKICEIKKANEVHRELGSGDLLCFFNYDKRKEPVPAIEAALDQELETLKADLDRDGKQKQDTADRYLWRKTNLVGMSAEVVRRRGALTPEQLEIINAARDLKEQQSLF